jgi:hypothetical protein
MVSTARIFFAGVATSALLVGVGFGGGILLGRAAIEPVHPTKMDQFRTAKRSLPTARVILPAPMETAIDPPATSSAPFVQAANPIASEPQKTSPEDQPRVASENANQARMQDMKNAERAEMAKVERKKAEATNQRRKAAERDRHRRYAERKARQEAALQAQEQRNQEQRQALHKQAGPFGLLAFGDGSEGPRQASFFGN